MSGRIIGISGPTVTTDLTDLKLYERVLVGHRQLTGEVVRLEADGAVIQIYEESRGLGVGEPVTGLGMPLSVTLGPGLLASMYAGLQRPLQKLKDLTGPFLHSSRTVSSLDFQESWKIRMQVKVGDSVKPGDCIGFVAEGIFEHSIQVPESLAGRVSRVAGNSCRLEEPVCVLEDGGEIFMYHTWPVRVARPVSGSGS